MGIEKGRLKLEEAIKIVEEWVKENIMTINKNKSGIFFFKKKHARKKKD